MFNPIGSNHYLLYFLMVAIPFDFAFTFVALNFGALYPEMFQSQSDRSYVAAGQQFFGVIGMIVGVAFAKSLGQSLGWGVMAALFAAIAETLKNLRFITYVLASLLIQLVTTTLATLSAFYTQYVVVLSALQNSLFLGLIFLFAVPSAFFWAKLSIQKTAVSAVMIATALYGAFSMLFLFDQTPLILIVTGALLGIPVAGFMVLLNILLAEVIDYDEKRTGKRREGMYLGMNGFIVRLSLSLQYAIMAIFFSLSHFNAKAAVQPAGAIFGLRFLLGGLPAVLLLVAIWLFRQYEGLTVSDH